MPTTRGAIFLDRDGVLNHLVDRGAGFLVHGKEVRWTAPFTREEFRVRDGVPEALERLGTFGMKRIVVTNQPDVTYGLMTREALDGMTERVASLPVDDVFICMHGRDEGCDCKKPRPGLLHQAAARHDIDLASSFIIGDTANDIEAGKAVGCTTILLDTEYNQDVTPHYRVSRILEAVDIIYENIH